MPIFSLGGFIKGLCVVAIAGITAVRAPVVLPMLFRPAPVPAIVYQRSTPERVATLEEQVKALQERLDSLERDRIGERLAKLEQMLSSLLALLVPIAIYMVTQTVESLRRRKKSDEAAAEEIADRVLEKLLEARQERAVEEAAGG